MVEEKNRNWKKYVIIFWAFFALGVVSLVLLFILIAKGTLGFMPTFEELENPPNLLSSEIYSEDGNILDKYFINENRTHVNYSNLPPHLIDALVATEDVRFFRHSGIDVRGLARVFKGILTGDTSSGGGEHHQSATC